MCDTKMTYPDPNPMSLNQDYVNSFLRLVDRQQCESIHSMENLVCGEVYGACFVLLILVVLDCLLFFAFLCVCAFFSCASPSTPTSTHSTNV